MKIVNPRSLAGTTRGASGGAGTVAGGGPGGGLKGGTSSASGGASGMMNGGGVGGGIAWASPDFEILMRFSGFQFLSSNDSNLVIELVCDLGCALPGHAVPSAVACSLAYQAGAS